MLDLLFSLITPTSLLVFTLVLLVTYHVTHTPRSLNMPPGPFPLPLLGNFHEFGKKPAQGHIHIFQTLASKYGKLFSLKLGHLYAIVINDYETLVETFVKKSDVFNDRPLESFYSMRYANKKLGAGVITANGQGWKMRRRTALKTMRDLGVGKQSLEEKVQEEVRILLDIFGQQKDHPIHTTPLLNMATSNVICQVIFGSRFDYDDEKFKTLLKVLNDSFSVNPIFSAVNFFPILKHVPYFHGKIDHFCRILIHTTDYVKSLTRSNESTFDPDNIRHFVDLFIKMRKDNIDNETFDEKNMSCVIVDLFVAGSDTTANSLSWAMLYMAKYPEIQERCRREIDLAIGKGKMPSLKDRDHLTYVEATILEVLRIRPVAPVGAPHCANRDVTIRGYHIPKNTVVFSNLIAINMDPQTFPNPENFDPGHFLDSDGKLTNRDRLLTFSMGPRICLGENIARMEMSIFFTAILQFFTLSPETGKPVDISPSSSEGVLRSNVQNVVFSRRE